MSSAVVTRRGAQKSKITTRAQLAAVEAAEAERKVKLYGRKPSTSLAEAKKRGKQKIMSTQAVNLGPDGQPVTGQNGVQLKDIYGNAITAGELIRGDTGLVYDEKFAEHRCLWDDGYPECPERFTRVLERCRELELVDRCKLIEPRMASESEILSKHTPDQVEKLKATSGNANVDALEELSSHYDAVFIHPSSYECSLLSAGSTIELVDAIVAGRVQNGMAIVRPPGHHAMKAEYNGYCFFNNVAIAAQHALDKLGLKRILIVDWDVHHGQGTQRMFYDDPRVLYFSIHRYECGTFWPNLRESDFDCIGEGAGLGYNFNVPLNRIGMTNGDYLAIWQQILLPVAMEYQPELIIISAGYDAAYGCPEGQMELTPAFYPHLLSPLMSLAQGRLAVVLEGGYCLSSLAEGGALTLRTLLGDPCPLLVEKIQPACESMQQTVLNCIHSHRPHWKNLQLNDTYGLEELNNINPQPNFHQVIQYYVQPDPQPEPVRYPTRNCYPVQSTAEKSAIEERLAMLKIATRLGFPSTRVCYVYDDVMLEHCNLHEGSHPEQPLRIAKIFSRHEEYKLLGRMKRLQPRHATTDELCLVHSRQNVNVVRRTVERDEMKQVADKFNSVYFHPKTFECATLAAGSVLQVVDEVLNGQSQSGVCIVRPPGHHAESDMPHGFCIFNNVAIAAQYAIRDHGLKRVLIVDWDVHHGNGTQHIFESSPNVLYVSVHRYDNATFFPKSKDADFDVVGSGAGEGFNVNIPWNKKGMGDQEYAAVFQQIILPIAYEFDPELVLISAGFDAAIGDPLGGCKVTPEAYGYFTQWLSSLANGRVIVCLEGGYNVNSISYAMTLCTKALLVDPLPMLQLSGRYGGPQSACVETLRNVLTVQEKYWKTLRFNKKLPDFRQPPSGEPELDSAFSRLQLSSGVSSSAYSGSSSASSPAKDESCNIGMPSDGDEQSGQCRKRKNCVDEPQAGGSRSTGTSAGEAKKETLHDFLAANLEALQNEEMFAVVPLKDCPHLKELNPDNLPDKISTKAPCAACDSAVENWVCLLCFRVCCGRYINEHALIHSVEADHPLALSFSDISVWCYKCESYVDNPVLHGYKNLVHQDKFGGEQLVWSYGSDLILDVQQPAANNGAKTKK
ncbi:histone deacetylase 6 isoform X1 [Toxorhynchites rutilus septentrionalis]|uniref:histone deacetylase 6 isoform X1 n=1 Tax=Toxorhynchites rutilus septentrionalis TaxID=329112 RepID=UPI0024786152|nr:histone deacetylase 6 isoform X1 [Toxorhynchites rutilus septentrionalis]